MTAKNEFKVHNTLVSTRVLEGLINNFYIKDITGKGHALRKSTIFHDDHLTKEHYTMKPWRLVYTNYHDRNRSRGEPIIFKFRNDSTGYYIARPWKKETKNGLEYKIIPKSHIQVGSIPAMMLQSRTIVPQRLMPPDLQEVDVQPLGRARYRDNTSVIQGYKKYYDNIKTINIKGHRMSYVSVHNERMKRKFLDFMTQKCVEYISMSEGRIWEIK